MSVLRGLVRARAVVTIVFALLLGLTYWVYTRVPTGFVPDEDQGYLMILVQAPPGASLDYTMNIVKQAEQIIAKLPEHNRMFAADRLPARLVIGTGLLTRAAPGLVIGLWPALPVPVMLALVAANTSLSKNGTAGHEVTTR